MTLLIKRLLSLFSLAITLILLIGIVIPVIAQDIVPFISRQFSYYEISNFISLNPQLLILASIIIHFLTGLFIINQINLLKTMKSINITLFFFIFYILLASTAHLVRNQYKFEFYLLETSLVIGLFLGQIVRNSKSPFLRLASTVFFIGFLFFTFRVTIPLESQFGLYGNYIGKPTNTIAINKLKLIDNNEKNVNILSTASNTIVIDFWSNNCAVCFKKFPLLKELQKEYEKNVNIEIIAVNVYSKREDIKKSKELLAQTNNLDLKNYYMSKDDSKDFNLRWYPKVVVIKNNKIVFEGHIETLRLFKQKYLE